MGMGKNKKTLDIVTFAALGVLISVICLRGFTVFETLCTMCSAWIFHMLGWYKGAVDYDIALFEVQNKQEID